MGLLKCIIIGNRSSTKLTKYFNTLFSTSSIYMLRERTNETGITNGKQNKFYFEASSLLENYNESDKNALYDKIPVVLLFGWAGSRDSQVKKYQSIYKKLGYHTIRFAPTDKLTFFSPNKQKPYAYELLELMCNNVKNNQIFIHMFSNACLFICYQYIVNEIKGGKSEKYDFFRENHKGIIIDSAIGSLCPPSILYGGIAGLMTNYFKFAPLKYLVAFCLTTSWVFYDTFNRGDHYFSRALKVAMHDERLVPTLNLYSTQDRIICPKKIANFFKDRKKLYPDLYLKAVVYDDAEHVLLYKKHPEDYLKHVHEHINYCKLDLRTCLGEGDLKKLMEVQQKGI